MPAPQLFVSAEELGADLSDELLAAGVELLGFLGERFGATIIAGGGRLLQLVEA
jgi:hypothetical protein